VDHGYLYAYAVAALGAAALALTVQRRPRLTSAGPAWGCLAALPHGWYASSQAPSGAPGTGGGARMAAAPAAVEPALDPISRRKLLRWVGWTSLLVVVGELLVGFLPFVWPRKTGSFGGTVSAGNVSDFKVGQVTKVTEGKFFISRVPEGFLALWQKCPHLGCTVPWRPDDRSEDSVEATGRFNCPCHGSIYDRYGQIITGPAPRPMDMFPITIRDGRIFVETGPSKVVERVAADHQKDPIPA
jgi:cytochrome b6-f complex iron-sulfur subunit